MCISGLAFSAACIVCLLLASISGSLLSSEDDGNKHSFSKQAAEGSVLDQSHLSELNLHHEPEFYVCGFPTVTAAPGRDHSTVTCKLLHQPDALLLKSCLWESTWI